MFLQVLIFLWLDAKAHRADDMFEVKAIFLERDTKIAPQLVEEVVQAIQRAADWHQTPRVVIRKSDPKEFAKLLRSELSLLPLTGEGAAGG